jgi:transposase
MKVTTLGIDLAKSIFRLHGVDAHGVAVLRRQLTRKQLLPFLAKLSPCLVGMEAGPRSALLGAGDQQAWTRSAADESALRQALR